MTQEARSAATGRKKISPVAAKPGSQSPAADTAAYQHYQAAVQLVQQGKFDKALAAFEKLLPTAPFEIAERCRMYKLASARSTSTAWLSSLLRNATTMPCRS